MELEARDIEVIGLICPLCQIILKPVAEVADCHVMDDDGIEMVKVAVMKCSRCGAGVGMAFRQKETP